MSIQDNLGSFPSELPHEVEDLRAEVGGWVEDESQLVSRNHGGVQLEPDWRVGTEQIVWGDHFVDCRNFWEIFRI